MIQDIANIRVTWYRISCELWKKIISWEKELLSQKEAMSMKDEKMPYKYLRILLIISMILVSFTAIIPSSSKSEPQTNKPCIEQKGDSLMQQQSLEENNMDQLDCLSDPNEQLLKLFIMGLINIDELSMWVLGVNRRLVVLKMMHEKRLIQASDIADSTDRSLQNISYAMRELEKQGLIKCLTPGKHTWKKYIPTEKGTKVFEKLKKNNFIS
ncbi:MAG: helix-turn-helix domain-containing protein [Candidatus Methanoperedens sp.]|nr:helix-turn-helix domain-containing protein [Candidatus Methanoperedens sp.]